MSIRIYSILKKAFAICLFLMLTNKLFAASINQLVFFGDSLTDNGNIYSLSFKFIPKSPPYFEGRFTNGPTWAENISYYYYNKYYINSKIYAYGGATAVFHAPKSSKIAISTLELQVYQYIAGSLFSDRSQILYSIWIGANDYLMDEKSDVNELTDTVVNQIAWAVETLISHGAKNFLILDLPDISQAPYGKNNLSRSRLQKLIDMHNSKLAAIVEKLKSKYADSKFSFVEISKFFEDVLVNPTKYNNKYHINIINLNDSCWRGGYTIRNLSENLRQDVQQRFHNGKINYQLESAILSSPDLTEAYSVGKSAERGITPCSNPDQYMFWDKIHPTAVVHQVIAKMVEDNLAENMGL